MGKRRGDAPVVWRLKMVTLAIFHQARNMEASDYESSIKLSGPPRCFVLAVGRRTSIYYCLHTCILYPLKYTCSNVSVSDNGSLQRVGFISLSCTSTG